MGWLETITGISNPVKVVWITTKDGQTLRGVLVYRNRDLFMLRAAQIGSMNEQTGLRWQPMMGDVCVPAENVSFWQTSLDTAFLSEDREE